MALLMKGASGLESEADQAGVSAVRVALQDTALTTQALVVSGVPPHAGVLRPWH